MAELNDYIPTTEKEAWIGILFACISADDHLPEQETETLVHMLMIKSMFKSSEVLGIYRNTMFLHSKTGSEKLLQLCEPLIAAENRPTVFAMAADLMLSDGIGSDKEMKMLDQLADLMMIDTTLKQKILDVIFIKNKGNREE